MDPVWTHYGPIMELLRTHYGLIVDSLWTHYGLICLILPLLKHMYAYELVSSDDKTNKA